MLFGFCWILPPFRSQLCYYVQATHNSTQEKCLFLWTSEHETAFTTLKKCLCSTPILALPDFTRPFCIETDASNLGVGAVLLLDSHQLAFLSRALSPKNQGLSAYEKEYMAILIAVD